jgi:hypothetical protein
LALAAGASVDGTVYCLGFGVVALVSLSAWAMRLKNPLNNKERRC